MPSLWHSTSILGTACSLLILLQQSTSASAHPVPMYTQWATNGVCNCTVCPADITSTNYYRVDKPFDGVTINVLGRSFGHDYFMTQVKRWEEKTGARVNVPTVAQSGTELNDLAWEDMATGANFFDGYIATNQNVPSMAHEIDPLTKESWLLNMDNLVKNSQTLDWPGIHSIFRQYLCLYNDDIVTLPFDGDQFLLFYRRDLQERDGWEVPQTWDDLITVAETYQGQDLNGDGQPDFPICQPNIGDFAFYSLYAPLLALLQTHPEGHVDVKKKIFPKRHGAFFQFLEDGLEPLVMNAAMKKVLPLMKRMYQLGNSEPLDLCCGTKPETEVNSGHGLYQDGRCAFYFSFPSVGTNSIVELPDPVDPNITMYPYQHGRMGTAELPGWTEYLDRQTNELKPCNANECPTAEELPNGQFLNRASWFANGGMGSIINNRVSQLKQLAAFDLFAFFSKELATTAAGVPYNPFRDPAHFNLTEYIEAGWNDVDAQLYLEASRNSLEQKNAVADLRVPYAVEGINKTNGFFRAYVQRFSEYNLDDSMTVEDVMEALDSDIRRWLQKHDTRVASSETYWEGTIETVYRRSMSLPDREEPTFQTYQALGNIRWVGWGLAVIILVCSLLCSAWVYRNRSTRLVRASQPMFLYMIAMGTFVMGAGLFPLGIDDTFASPESVDIACMSWPWLFACGFTISFSALFSKQWRINKIFHNPRFQRIKVTEKDVIVPFVIMFAVNVLLLILWTILDPLKWEVVEVDDLNSYGRCAPDPNSSGIASTVFIALILSVNALALVLANVQAYQARMISDEFSESQYIGLAMFAVLEVLLFTFPVSFLVQSNPSARYFVYSGIVFVISMSLLLLVFVPKLKLLIESMSGPSRKGLRGVNTGASSADFGIRINNPGGVNVTGLSQVTTSEPSLGFSNAKLQNLMTALEEKGLDAEEVLKEAGLSMGNRGGASVSFAENTNNQVSAHSFADDAPAIHGHEVGYSDEFGESDDE